jgi:hypothetical protein
MNAPATDMNAATSATTGASAMDTANYPLCSRSVQDKCIQRGAAHKTAYKARSHRHH